MATAALADVNSIVPLLKQAPVQANNFWAARSCVAGQPDVARQPPAGHMEQVTQDHGALLHAPVLTAVAVSWLLWQLLRAGEERRRSIAGSLTASRVQPDSRVLILKAELVCSCPRSAVARCWRGCNDGMCIPTAYHPLLPPPSSLPRPHPDISLSPSPQSDGGTGLVGG